VSKLGVLDGVVGRDEMPESPPFRLLLEDMVVKFFWAPVVGYRKSLEMAGAIEMRLMRL